MRESPRVRRLRNDLKALERVRDQSSILKFSTPGPLYGGPPESYLVQFFGRGVWRPEGTHQSLVRERHDVSIHLGASYPRGMPELTWKTPIFHPNISASGVVCLGGYGTHWVPSLGLDELCEMLWDMIRYANFDVESPYNREAAVWAKTQTQVRLPIDERPIRDRLAAGASDGDRNGKPPITSQPQDFIIFESDVVEAEVVEAEVVDETVAGSAAAHPFDSARPDDPAVGPERDDQEDIMFLD